MRAHGVVDGVWAFGYGRTVRRWSSEPCLKKGSQSGGVGSAGTIQTLGWIFYTLHVRLMYLTAALDTVCSARPIDRAGFVRMGERDSVRPDGTIRRSIYWELTREGWRDMISRLTPP